MLQDANIRMTKNSSNYFQVTVFCKGKQTGTFQNCSVREKGKNNLEQMKK